MLEERRDIFYPFSLIVHNTKPIGHEVCDLMFLKFIVGLLFSDILNHLLFAGSCWSDYLYNASSRFQSCDSYFSPIIFFFIGECFPGIICTSSGFIFTLSGWN